ncbi:MAG: peptide deformylase [Acidobacteria bacterium]|nr:peptide deformylase [Acidobacteriota bacterium]
MGLPQGLAVFPKAPKLLMALRPIVKYPEPVLNTRAREVSSIDSEVHRLVADMIETMHAAPGVGLAANQVGVLLRIAVVDLSVGKDPSALVVLINPRVLSSDGQQVDEEGCLSIPGITEMVPRPLRTEVEALNLKGRPIRIRGEGLMARALLHEIDHLDGVLFLDRLSPLKRRLLRKKIQKLIRDGDWAGVSA